MQNYFFKISRVGLVSLALLTIALYLISCDEIFVDDISNTTVKLVAPQNDCISKSQSITFWWQSIEGAQKYSLQIVTPSFNSPERLIVDTLIVKTNYTAVLENGTYEWRVAGVNNISETEYSINRLTINSD